MAGVRTIAVTNQKGGVGKTTTAVNLAAALARRGHSVCLVDMDPQAHLTMHFGIDPTALPVSMFQVMTEDAPLTAAVVAVEPNLSVVPATIDLAAAEVELAGAVGREQVLRDRLAAEELPYDLVMVDCAPSLGLLTLNALTAAQEVMIPLQPHFLALQGLGRLLDTVSLVQRRINPALKVSGVIFCMYESGTRLAAEIVEDVQGFFADARGGESPWSEVRIFQTRIRRNIKLAECPSHGTTIINYDPSSHGAADYAALADEFLGAAAGEQADAQPADAPEEPAPPPPAGEGTLEPAQPSCQSAAAQEAVLPAGDEPPSAESPQANTSPTP